MPSEQLQGCQHLFQLFKILSSNYKLCILLFYFNLLRVKIFSPLSQSKTCSKTNFLCQKYSHIQIRIGSGATITLIYFASCGVIGFGTRYRIRSVSDFLFFLFYFSTLSRENYPQYQIIQWDFSATNFFVTTACIPSNTCYHSSSIAIYLFCFQFNFSQSQNPITSVVLFVYK